MDRIIVVGRGMIGSAAARHLAGLTDGVTLIGPDEPADYAAHDGVFASHYDEGRMTRISDPDPDWAVTSKRSVARYDEIAAESDISFFTNYSRIYRVVDIIPSRMKICAKNKLVSFVFFFYKKISNAFSFWLIKILPISIKVNTTHIMPPITIINSIRIHQRDNK